MDPTVKLICPECGLINGAENDIAQRCAKCHMILTPLENIYKGRADVGTREKHLRS